MSRAWVILKRTGRLLKFLFICLTLTICIFLLWRVFSTGTPDRLDHLTPNDKLNQLYYQQGEELYAFNQVYDTMTRAERNEGYFGVPDAVFIPEINQAQIVFRYNNSTIKALANDYSLSAVPDREEELFDVTLLVYIDLTPENTEDNYNIGTDTVRTVRIPCTVKEGAKSTLYNFYRYVFDFENGEEPLDLQELMDSGTLIAIHTQIYYKGDLDYEKTAYGALCIYDYRRENIRVNLSKNDKKALGE